MAGLPATLKEARMGGVIELSRDADSGHLWAGWVFRQILEDTLLQCCGDKEMSEAFEKAEAIGALFIYDLPAELADRVRGGMQTAIEGILTGKLSSTLEEKPYGALSKERYLEPLRLIQVQLSHRPG